MKDKPPVKIKEGDKVRCIDAFEQVGFLTHGSVYLVARILDHASSFPQIFIEGIPHRCFSAQRFEVCDSSVQLTYDRMDKPTYQRLRMELLKHDSISVRILLDETDHDLKRRKAKIVVVPVERNIEI